MIQLLSTGSWLQSCYLPAVTSLYWDYKTVTLTTSSCYRVVVSLQKCYLTTNVVIPQAVVQIQKCYLRLYSVYKSTLPRCILYTNTLSPTSYPPIQTCYHLYLTPDWSPDMWPTVIWLSLPCYQPVEWLHSVISSCYQLVVLIQHVVASLYWTTKLLSPKL